MLVEELIEMIRSLLLNANTYDQNIQANILVLFQLSHLWMVSARIVHLNCLEFCSDFEAMHTRCCRVLGFATSLQGFEVSLLDDKINALP